jgi:hypothetical protein
MEEEFPPRLRAVVSRPGGDSSNPLELQQLVDTGVVYGAEDQKLHNYCSDVHYNTNGTPREAGRSVIHGRGLDN